MRLFADLYAALDATTSTNTKVAAMVDYFADAPAADAAWAVWFLSGRRGRRPVKTGDMATWAAEMAEIPQWLFEDSYTAVGDLAETVALLFADRHDPDSDLVHLPLHRWLEDNLHPLRGLDPEEQRRRITLWWEELPLRQTFLVNKLITGGFRVGVSANLVARALARVADLPPAAVAHRLMGSWEPTADSYRALLSAEGGEVDLSRPYPFFLASPLEEGEPDDVAERLGEREGWLAEWKWDGIRAQAIRRGGTVFLWSRGEELVTGRYPEISEAVKLLPDGTVLDGEIVAWGEDDAPLPFGELQRRINRKEVGDKLRREVPVVFLAYDLLEADGEDLRQVPLDERRRHLATLLDDVTPLPRVRLSPEVEGEGWDDLAALRGTSRDRRVEGLMLKRRDSPYRTGRKRGDWWKWKVDPFTVDAVMIYAQAGHGRRANLYTDYTFAVWRDDELVPVAKAYSGLSDAEIGRLDRWIRRHTVERFGPVRSVEPEQVFEIAFEGIRPSSRHKSGLAVRFPRILRWRHDKPPAEADRLETLEALLDAVG